MRNAYSILFFLALVILGGLTPASVWGQTQLPTLEEIEKKNSKEQLK